MSYLPLGHHVAAGEIDHFEDCDPSHYAGGYDIDLTYGHSLPPSYETCYPRKTSASDHPLFASHTKPDAAEAPGREFNSYPRPGHPATADGRVYGGPKPNYGFQPGCGASGHASPEPGYGSGYSMNPPSSEFGSSHGRSYEYENPRRKPDYGEFGYRPGMGKLVSDFGGSRHGSGHGGWPEKPSYPRPSYPEPNCPIPSYPEPSYPRNYPEPSYPPNYPELSYPHGYGPQSYEREISDYEERKHHHSHGRGHHYRRQ
ncbi:hypothetical protein F511_25377 [Dorcoceras hygrometricum]|uniref:Uncharacterized protein n=1 Tax=Dorcoceras hygrometricum TaxID=472368 RepID=A0A2Z7AAI0_9LAMI|nr:hypothetical protein F511_25377 [Dorcoceras hygrometricum]